MSEAIVTIRGLQNQPDRQFSVRVNGTDANFEIKAERIEATFSRNMDRRLFDLIDIAGCIFAADSRVSRGSNLRPDFGKGWRRKMGFRFAVREPEFWNRQEIKSALQDAVLFMSDDRLNLEFVEAENLPIVQPMFDFGSERTFQADDVILFSGGLDSLAGAYERLATAPGNVILLSHISANKRIAYAKNLVDRLKATFPGRILWVPVTAHLKGVEARETTQRTRSLLFACLGFVTAKLSGARRLHFYENGIVSANLPIASQVIGTMASRTTHPQTIHCLAALLDAIAPGEIELDNPYSGFTKAEVAKRLADLGGADLIRDSVSCSHVRLQTILHPHCGACSQCLDRRFGILAAGLSRHDPSEGYEINVLVDPRPKDTERVLAVDWTRHALRMASITDADFLASFGAELSRLVVAKPDLSSAEHARSIVAMHRTHGVGVSDALSVAIKEHSHAILKQTLPETSLLRMIVADLAALPLGITFVPNRVPGILPADQLDEGWTMPKVTITGTATSARVVIDGLGEVSGVNATPAWALTPYHTADREAEVEPGDYQFVAGGTIAQKLGVVKQTIRQRIKRLRDDLADQFEAVEGQPPDQPILIQSHGNRDYRLDPRMEIVVDAITDPQLA